MEQVKKKQVIDMKTDIQLLLECLDFQKDDQSAVKQALVTLSSILQAAEVSKELFRNVGGLQKVLELVTSTQQHQVIEAGLYCLGSAVERNVFSQKLLCTASVFTFLHAILAKKRDESYLRKKQTATFLLICLVTNNGYGQNLARQSACLQDIIMLIRTSLPQRSGSSCDWLEQVDGSSIDLWTALVSAACACVNNPINDENQRLCASLLPFVFNVLSKHTDVSVIKSALCLVGLTVANNESNQDRVRQCGGLDLLLKRYKALLSAEANQTADSLPVLVQIMATLDACVTDNERNSQKFGELGGLVLVLRLMAEHSLSAPDLVQAVLLLAHVVEVCNENKRYISMGGGMTVLIQQLTQTDHEELSKTIKYLLHMCVASDETEGSEDLITTDNSMEQLMHKMEKMQRHNDLEMLKKIQELDQKLHSMEHGASERHSKIKNKSLRCDEDAVGVVASAASGLSPEPVSSSVRENTLLEELAKEKQACRQLQRLNEMLQEDIRTSHSALVRAYSPIPVSHSNVTSPIGAYISHNPPVLGIIEKNPMVELCRNEILVGCDASGRQGKVCVNCSCSSHVKAGNTNSNPIDFSLKQSVEYAGVTSVDTPRKNNLGYVAVSGDISNNANLDNSPNSQLTEPLYIATKVDCPLDLSSKNFYVTKYSTVSKGVDLLQQGNTQQAASSRSSAEISHQDSKECLLYYDSKLATFSEVTTQTIDCRNAEIQCGTPFIKSDTKAIQEESKTSSCVSSRSRNRQTKCHSNQRNQIDIPVMVQVVTNTESRSSVSTQIVVEKGFDSKTNSNKNTNAITRSGSAKMSRLLPGQEYDQITSPFSNDTSKAAHSAINMSSSKEFYSSSSVLKSNKSEHLEKDSANDKFLKPVALPPKSKVRVTPLLGSSKLPATRQLSNVSTESNHDSDAASEFDTSLIKKSNISRKNKNQKVQENAACPDLSKQTSCFSGTRASNVIKSQNNVWRLDRQLESREHNVAETWCVIPSTPRHQPILPVRPAFSDCGTRRKLPDSPDSPCSVKSVGKLMNDSGIHSPPNILCLSTSTSPVDSNVDELRSSSDVSEVEELPPSITRAALRSHRLVKFERQDKCPGCQSSFKLNRPLMTSKTYTIEIETNPNTCLFHRKVRRCERKRANNLRKARVQEGKTKQRLLTKDLQKKRNKSDRRIKKKNIFEMSSDSNVDTEYLSDEASEKYIASRTRSRQRRKRMPYTDEEEANLREGVRRLGKHWNQILLAYKFHSSRTNVDLMEKYKRIRMTESRGGSSMVTGSLATCRTRQPFSMCEERRLQRGVAQFGHNWKSILQVFRFTAGRTTEELRSKWRSMQRQKNRKQNVGGRTR